MPSMAAYGRDVVNEEDIRILVNHCINERLARHQALHLLILRHLKGLVAALEQLLSS